MRRGGIQSVQLSSNRKVASVKLGKTGQNGDKMEFQDFKFGGI